MKRIGLMIALTTCTTLLAAEPAAWPQRVPAPGGEVIHPDENARRTDGSCRHEHDQKRHCHRHPRIVDVPPL